MTARLKSFTYDNACVALQNWAKEILMEEEIEYDDSGEIPLFIQYLNYHSKMVTVKPRKVSLSKNFSVDAENQSGLDDLIDKLTNGIDVNLYLSKASIKANETDGMFDNFGIKHFHLGKNIKNGFVQRTKEIALAIVTDDEVFFVVSKLHGVGHSKMWYEKDVLEILHKERPDLIEHCKVDNFIDISHTMSKTKDIRNFRNSNINGVIELDDGTCYMPYNLGQTLSGFRIAHMMIMTSFAHHMREMVNGVYETNNSIVFSKINQLEIDASGKPVFIEMQFYDDLKKDYEYFEFSKSK